MNTLLLKALAALLFVAAVVGTTWMSAKAHYEEKYVSLKTQYETMAKDQEAENAKTLSRYAAAAQEINNEAQNKLAGAGSTIDRLVRDAARSRANQVSVCPAAPVVTDGAAHGPATAAGAGPDPVAAGPSLALDAEVLAGVLDTAADALTAEILWRAWARSVK
jgi:hypothetical protein